MGFKQICLAITLPVIGLLSFYWIRQRKKITDTTQECSPKVKRSAEADRSTVELQNVITLIESIEKLLIDDESNSLNDSLSNRTITSESTSSTANEDLESTIKSTDESIRSVDALSNTRSTILTNGTINNLTEIESTEIYMNNNDNDFRSKLESMNEQTVEMRSIEKTNNSTLNSLDNLNRKFDLLTLDSTTESNVLDAGLKVNGDFSSTSTNQSLVEGEELFEFMGINKNRSISNSENSQLLDSKDSITFNTANNASFEATIDSSINSIDGSTLNSANFSMRTLRSIPNESLTNKENESIRQVNVEEEKEVKSDYDANTSMNSTANKVVNNSLAANDVNRTDANSSATADNDDIVENDSEKFLNLTEESFKNDSKIEVVKDLIEELTSKVSEESKIGDGLVENSNNDSTVGHKSNCSLESEKNVSLNNEDDSICVVFDKNEEDKKAETNSSKSISSPDQSSKPAEKIPVTSNLDESDDLEIVWECTNKPNAKILSNKTHQLNNNLRNSPQKVRQSNVKIQNNLSNGPIQEFCFELPRQLVGLLIGARRAFINKTMEESNTIIKVYPHPTAPGELSLCFIRGTSTQIEIALSIIRERFPLSKFPQITLKQTNPVEPIPLHSILPLPQGVHVEVVVSNFETPQHVYLQQPTHPTYPLLKELDENMISTYKFNETPGIDQPTVGMICAVEHKDGWYRTAVQSVNRENCSVRLLDYGGIITKPKFALRQVERNHMKLPFQANECFLSNIEPINGVWSNESVEFFRNITQKQILQALIVNFTSHQVPVIYLYRIIDQQPVLINNELCVRGYAKWV